MKAIRTTLLALAVALTLCCCQSKERYMKDFTQFVADVEAGCDNYSENDWKHVDTKFDYFADKGYEKYAQDLTPDEQKQVGRLTAKYYKLRLASAIGSYGRLLGQGLSNGANLMSGFMEELGNDTDAMSHFIDDIDWDDLGEGLNDAMEELSESMSDMFE